MDPKGAPASPALELQQVLEILQSRGTLQILQQRALQALEKHRDLRQRVEQLVSNSRAVSHPVRDRKLLPSVKEEVGARVVEEMALELWRVLQDDSGVAVAVEAAVQQALAELYTADHAAAQRPNQP